MKVFRLDATALATAGASGMLALDARAFGSIMALGQIPAEDRADKVADPAAKAASDIAVVSIRGPLEQRATEHLCGFSDGYDAIAARFISALMDPEVGAVVLAIDSPGGDAAGLFEAVRRMSEAKADSGKPVLAYADELAASAAYAIATVADEIYLPATGEVGSIGVLTVHVEQSRALENAGIKTTIIRSGSRKAEVNAFEPLTDEARSALQARVDAMAGTFAEAVAKARGMTSEAVLGLQGTVLGGEAAVAAGLANAVMSFERVLLLAGEKAMMKVLMNDKIEAAIKLASGLGDALPELHEMSTDAVVGTVTAWRASAAKTEQLAARVAELEALETDREQKAEAAERVALISSAVRSGKLPPAIAFADEEKQAVSAAYAEMKLETLRAHVAALPVLATAGAKPAPVQAGELSQREMDRCKAKGIDPQKYAAVKAAISGVAH